MNEIRQNILNNCHFCSVISKSNGEDPIGSAETYEHWLAMEMELPWSEKRLEENSLVAKAIALISEKIESGVNIRGQLIAPDREYSQPGYTRLFYYRRPTNMFATFEKHEFIVPNADVESLAIALIETIPQPPRLTDWQQYRQESSQIRELMVCTDGSVDLACGKFGSPIYQQLRSEYAGKQIRVWRINHFGGHQFAPTLLDWPSGQCWGHLSPEVLNLLVWCNGSVRELRPFYRGWGGLTQFEQSVEREIWMREGWQWLNYHKAGQVLAIDEANEDWAKVRINFLNPDGSIKGAYEAKVEVNGSVITAWNSGTEQTLERVKQYSVTCLLKVV